MNTPTTIPFGSKPIAPVTNTNPNVIPFGSKPIIPITPSQPVQPPTQNSILPGILTPQGSEFVTGAVKNVTDIYKNAPQDFINQYIGPNSSQDPSAIKRVIGNSLGGAMSIMNTILAPITGTVKTVTDALSQHIANNVDPNNPIVSKVVNFVSGTQNELAKLSTTHPEAVRNLGNALNLILLGLAGGSEGGVGLDKPIGSIEGIAQGVKSTAQGIKNTAENIKSGIGNNLVESAKSDWAKPTNTPNASYNKATQIFDTATSKGHSIPDTLVNNGVRLSQNIQDGKYVTADTAEQIRTDAGKMSYETLRPALEEANSSVAKVPTQDIINKTIADVKKTIGSTPGDIEAQISKIQKEGEALLRKYPDGMNLTDLHDNKITYAKNGGYTFGDTPDTGNIKAVNRAYGRVLGDTLEKVAPEGIPVKQFNAELAKQYQAADYLDALNNKKVPVSIQSKVAKTAAKVVGASVGESLGGGIMGGVGGYHIGGMIESTFENMPNPFKEYFLRNLEKTNPEAFAKVSEYLGMAKNDRLNRLLLPSGGNTIYGNAPEFKVTTPEQLKALQAENNARIKQQQFNNTKALPQGKTIFAPEAPFRGTSAKDLQIEQVNNTELQNTKLKNNTQLPSLKSIYEGENKLYNKSVKKIPDQAETKPNLNQGETLKTIPKNLQPLVQEARKYKSAEEFVKAQPTLYHATDKQFSTFKPNLDAEEFGTWFSKDKGSVQNSDFPIVMERYINPNAKLISIDDFSKLENTKAYLNFNGSPDAFLSSKGYAGIDHGNGVIQLIDANKNTLTKSQLTDFYNQVTKKAPIKGLPKK